MPSGRLESHLFLLRIWREPREISGRLPLWRGWIEYVPHGEGRWVASLPSIEDFLARYIDELKLDTLAGIPGSIANTERGESFMAVKLAYSLSIQVAAGPSIAASSSLEVEAYDKVQVLVADGESDRAVNIGPGGAGLMQFLSVTATDYDSGLTYKVNDAAANAIPLDAPHLFIGAGAVGLLDNEPTQLLFANATGSDVTVHILVGRDATP